VSLAESVAAATEWTLGAEGRAAALGQLARSLAVSLESADGQTAQLAKELRATLEDLEKLRDGNDAEADLGVVLSTPVWDAKKSG
jgi:hypothetical protein